MTSMLISTVFRLSSSSGWVGAVWVGGGGDVGAAEGGEGACSAQGGEGDVAEACGWGEGGLDRAGTLRYYGGPGLAMGHG